MKLLSNEQSSSIMFLMPFLPALALLIHPYAFTSRCRDCLDLTPCEAYGRAKAVFVGRAISGEEIKWDDRNGGKKGIQLVGKVRFIVEQSFKGVEGNEVEVIYGDRECGYGPFEKGERYLLYLNRYDNEGLSADICSRSTHISGADEDLKFLSSLTSKTCSARLYGTVGNFDIDLYKRDKEGLRSVGRIYIGVPGITITARDNRGQILTAVTDREGAFEFTSVLPDVAYTVRAELPGYFQKAEYDYTERNIGQIGACGCGRVYFPAIYDGSISGRIIGPGGKPVANANIAIVRANEKDSRINTQVSSANTDEKGRYILEQVPPGNYVLGVNITSAPDEDSPYRPTWHPDAATRPAASPIDIGPGQKLSGYDLIIPRRLAERTIEGTVIWPDGSPVAKASIYLSPSAQPGQIGRPRIIYKDNRGHFKSTGGQQIIYTDNQGRFKINGYEGIAYYVVASSASRRPALWKYFYAEPPLVELKGENVTGLRLTLSWNEETFKDFFKKK